MKYWKKVKNNNSKNHNHREEKLDLDQQRSFLSVHVSLTVSLERGQDKSVGPGYIVLTTSSPLANTDFHGLSDQLISMRLCAHCNEECSKSEN